MHDIEQTLANAIVFQGLHDTAPLQYQGSSAPKGKQQQPKKRYQTNPPSCQHIYLMCLFWKSHERLSLHVWSKCKYQLNLVQTSLFFPPLQIREPLKLYITAPTVKGTRPAISDDGLESKYSPFLFQWLIYFVAAALLITFWMLRLEKKVKE